MHPFFEYIRDEAGNKSKHQQIVDGIVRAITEGVVKENEALPSVNAFLKELPFARMTVVKALNELKKQGIVESKDRSGSFVKKINEKQERKVMLFLTGFTAYHEILYQEVLEKLSKEKVVIDLYFHHGNPSVFKTIIEENRGLYDLYAVTAFDDKKVKKTLSEFPKKKLLQIVRPPIVGETSFVSQGDYEEVYDALVSVKKRISKYKKLILVLGDGTGIPRPIVDVFIRFCKTEKIKFDETSIITKDQVQEGYCYFVVSDRAMIELIKVSEEKKLTLGKTLGLLSYNDTDMKEVIRNGITVLSTDFAEMGKSIGEFIKTRKAVQKRISTVIKLRNSL